MSTLKKEIMDFNEFFTQFNTVESYRILAFLLVAFLLGLWVGRLTRRGRIRRLEAELEEKKKELAELRAEIDPLREELDLKKADLKKISFDKEELEAKVQRLESDKARLYREVSAINEELEESKTLNQEQRDNLALLQTELEELRQKNDTLSRSAEKDDDAVDNMAQMQSVYNATRVRLEALEEKLNRLDEENQMLKKEVGALKVEPATPLARSVAAPPPEEEEEEPSLEKSFTREKSVMGRKIFLDEEQPKDDLTRIAVIGPFLQDQLNQIGIYTYKQISEFDEATIEEVTKAIGYFPGRIEKDDWVGQAKQLYEASLEAEPENTTPDEANDPVAYGAETQQSETNPDTDLAVGGAHLPPADSRLEDLKIIEGIGPKIESLLKDAGMADLSALSEADPEEIRRILLAASDRYQIHDPSTWPAQARLAVNGNWELLEEYQDQLKGGREAPPEDD